MTNQVTTEKELCEFVNPIGSSPKVSVIVPVYKVEKYLPECIDSILAQTFTDFELILVDDGSPDNSGKICDDYATRDPRIRVFHKENGGVSSARNFGIKNSKGEWIVFVDSDDFVGESYLSHLLQGSLGGDLVVAGWVQYNRNRKIVNIRKFFNSILTVEKGVVAKGDICCGIASKLFDGSVCRSKRVLFDETLAKSEDALFTLRYLEYAKRVLLNPNFEDYHYNERGSGGARICLSYKQQSYLFSERIDAYKKLCRGPFSREIRCKLAYNFSFVLLALYHPNTCLEFPLRMKALSESVTFLEKEGFQREDFCYPWKFVMLKRFRVFDFFMSIITFVYYRVYRKLLSL